MIVEGQTRVHFIGVGGAGMSAIAKVLLERGHFVSGSDLKRSSATTVLEAIGATVQIGHDGALVDEHRPDLVVASSAIPDTNPEIRRARELGIRVAGRGEALAKILEGSRSIVVAGTHGKTTTTSLIVTILGNAGMDPTYLVGGGLNDVGTNARHGRSDIAVAESDESDGSFLLLSPHIAVVTNVESDHLDYWKSAAEIRRGFLAFIERVDPDGAIVMPAGSDLLEEARKSGRKIVTFGPAGDVSADGIELSIDDSSFTVAAGGERAAARLRIPGLHNVSNALAAVGAALEVGISLEVVAARLSDFQGVERRFQIKGRSRGVTVIDDYAHHPTEIKATLAAALPGSWDRIVAVFQPHRYSRTQAFRREFGRAFADADRVVVTDVYGAGEEPVPGVTGKIVADSVCANLPGRPVAYLPHRADLVAYLETITRPGDLLMTLGAGDITTLGEEMLTRLGSSR
ncbi:MAG: UDP-N-acetylmuramate--L-alanine ligase [Actinomycetota bacterium]|nr:UDP-N-acetylmuramate--L-alanine ligase [Actinomycetota bacterium]